MSENDGLGFLTYYRDFLTCAAAPPTSRKSDGCSSQIALFFATGSRSSAMRRREARAVRVRLGKEITLVPGETARSLSPCNARVHGSTLPSIGSANCALRCSSECKHRWKSWTESAA